MNDTHTPSRYDIPIGRKNAISREALAAKWGVSDRTARRIVGRMRDEKPTEPYIIVSTSHQTGYWRSNAAADLDHFEREWISRATKQFKPLIEVNTVRQMLSGQVRMEL
jgi:hypothetical protein